MELKDFISESIKQITDGLIEGHEYIQQKQPGSEGVQNVIEELISTLLFNQTKVIRMILAAKSQ